MVSDGKSEIENNPLRIAFRVDSSQEIGSGHVARCLNLADAACRHGAKCIFICRDHPGNQTQLIRSRGYDVVLLPRCIDSSIVFSANDYQTWAGASIQDDADQTIHALGGNKVDWLVVDHYALGRDWERLLRPYCHRLMVIDDLANRPHDCDLLLDQNLVENQYRRYEGLVGDDCVRLLGPRYALLQPEYVDLHLRVELRVPPVRRVFAYFGAADGGNLSGRVIRAFSSAAGPDVSLDVVVAPSSPFWPDIRELAENDSRVRLHGHIPSLAPLLRQADVAIGAGGATSWERCCLGVPTYVITLAENQVAGTRALEQQGAIRWLGNSREITDSMLFDGIREALEGLCLSAMSESSLALVDGIGTARVIENMLPGVEMRFVVRPLRPTDERLTLDWANDLEVRRNSFSVGRIEAATHRRWLASRLADTEKCRFYVVETTRSLPAGSVRFECISREAWEVHYSMDQCLRGRGKGTPFLQAALDCFRLSVESGTRVIGRVKQGNLASQHTFRKLGFSESPDGQDFKYQLVLQK